MLAECLLLADSCPSIHPIFSDLNGCFGDKRTSTNSVYCLVSRIALRGLLRHYLGMLTEIYIEALLVDEELDDQVWGLWNARIITVSLACVAWILIALSG